MTHRRPPGRSRRWLGEHSACPRTMCLRLCHSVGSPPNCLDKGLPVRTWRLRGRYAKIRGPYQDKSDRVAGVNLSGVFVGARAKKGRRT